MIFESLKNYAVGTFDLGVAPRVGNRSLVDINHVVLAKILVGRSCEGRPEVSDDSIGHTETMCYLLDEFCRFFRRDLSNRSDFNRLGEFVDSHKDVLVAARSGSEWSYRIKAPRGKVP
jgi:hypothetical protein